MRMRAFTYVCLSACSAELRLNLPTLQSEYETKASRLFIPDDCVVKTFVKFNTVLFVRVKNLKKIQRCVTEIWLNNTALEINVTDIKCMFPKDSAAGMYITYLTYFPTSAPAPPVLPPMNQQPQIRLQSLHLSSPPCLTGHLVLLILSS